MHSFLTSFLAFACCSRPRATMTSQRTGSSPNIVWDKSRLHLHAERAARNGQALVPASSGAVTRRVSSMTSTTAAPMGTRPGQKAPESELKMSFDPMKDLHMWTMWRVAVNGRIVDETRRRNRAQPANGGDYDSNPFGRALIKTPLDRFIRVENGSQSLAGVMMDPHGEGGGHLATQQFVFYGVPRVVLKKPKQRTVNLPQ